MLQRIVIIFTRQTGGKSGRRQKKSYAAEDNLHSSLEIGRCSYTGNEY